MNITQGMKFVAKGPAGGGRAVWRRYVVVRYYNTLTGLVELDGELCGWGYTYLSREQLLRDYEKFCDTCVAIGKGEHWTCTICGHDEHAGTGWWVAIPESETLQLVPVCRGDCWHEYKARMERETTTPPAPSDPRDVEIEKLRAEINELRRTLAESMRIVTIANEFGVKAIEVLEKKR